MADRKPLTSCWKSYRKKYLCILGGVFKKCMEICIEYECSVMAFNTTLVEDTEIGCAKKKKHIIKKTKTKTDPSVQLE